LFLTNLSPPHFAKGKVFCLRPGIFFKCLTIVFMIQKYPS
jgi:hypothetical protein